MNLEREDSTTSNYVVAGKQYSNSIQKKMCLFPKKEQCLYLAVYQWSVRFFVKKKEIVLKNHIIV